jgi:hypothetical protein
MMQNQRVTSVTRNEMVLRLDRVDDNSKPLENVGKRVYVIGCGLVETGIAQERSV